MSMATLHEFQHVRDAFPKIQLSDSWGITTSKSYDVIWNVVLAYLNSFPLSDEEELKRRIKRLTGYEKVNENFKISIEKCNPFLHRDASFLNKEIYRLMAAFKEKVVEYIKTDESLLPIRAKNFKYLQASSKLLSCNIVLISFPCKAFKDEILVNVFPVQTSKRKRKGELQEIYRSDHITILDELIFPSKKRKPQEKFSFCIPEKIGIQKQWQALAEILKLTIGVNEEIIQTITRLPDITEHCLITLLKHDLWQVIPFIYKSPYALSKLAEAGFETDPRTKDSTGKSAFFHALKTEESQLVFLLYEHVANDCLQIDASVRSPDTVVVENLMCMKNFLKVLGAELDSEEVSEKSRSLFKYLCRFHEFQIEICKSINVIRQKINYYDHSEKEYEVLQRKETILAILKTYETYFDSISGESYIKTDYISRLKEFLEHQDYFDKLDFNSAVMFFDNLFLLKERLKLPNNAYLDIESHFFLFIFFRKYLEQYEKQKFFHSVSRWITFQERLSLRKQLCRFKEILEKIELSDYNIVDAEPEEGVPTLIDLPEIYGQFLISRLQHYLNTATEIIVKDIKSILVIERCLQVLAECCEETHFNSVKKMVSSALPKSFIKHLNLIRNQSSSRSARECLYRNELEQDVELFKGIQKELVMLKQLLLPIFSVYKWEMDKLLFSHCEISVCNFLGRNLLKEHENQLNVILLSPETEESQRSVPNAWKCRFYDMLSSFWKEINDLNCNGNFLGKATASGYKYIVQNMISTAGEKLESLIFPVPKRAIDELDIHFWSLERILTYITTDRKLIKHSSTLTLMLKERKSIFTKLRENATQLQKTNKSTNLSTDRTIFAQCGIVSMQFSTEPENTRDDNQDTVSTNSPFANFGDLFNKEPINSAFSNSAMDTKEREEADDLFENAEMKLSMHSTTQKSMSTHGKILVAERNKKAYQIQKTNKSTNSSTDETPVAQGAIDIMQFSTESQDTGDNNKEAVNQNIPFVNFGDLFIKEPISSTYSNSAIDTKEREEADNLSENEIILKESNTSESYTVFEEASRTRSIGNLSLARVCQDYPVTNGEDSPAEMTNVEIKTYIEEAETCLDDYKKFTSKLFQDFPGDSNEDFCFKNIEDYFLILEGNASNKEGKLFRHWNETNNARNLDEHKLYAEVPKRNISEFSTEFLESKPVRQLKEMGKVENVSSYSKLVSKGQSNEVPVNRFEFFRSRIKILKHILIDENNSIHRSWDEATTPRTKDCVKEKIVQLYLNDSEMQASVEMLLFHFRTNLCSKELEQLWEKTTNLFNGINLRNFLIHGHSLPKSLGRLHDPRALPSELVEKMLELISDEHVIDCMHDILDKSKTNFSGFMKIMTDEDNQQFKHLCEKIQECQYWKQYALLIPFQR